MNQIDFTKQGGFPLDQDVAAFLQGAIMTAANTAYLGGSTYVLSGCQESGVNIDNGIVVINGEILPLMGGAKQEKVVIIEETVDMAYEDGVVHPSTKIRYATFGDDGVTNLLWASFKRNTAEGVLARLDRLERIAAPFSGSGGMLLWKRPAIEIPAGWQEVADWRGRLPMGYNPNDADFNVVGKNGGSKSHTLTIDNIPAHSHAIWGQDNEAAPTGSAATELANIEYPDTANAKYFRPTGKTGKENPDAISNLSPFRIVVFIEYIGN